MGEGGIQKITGGRSTDESTLPLDHALLVTRTIRGGGIRRRVLFSLPSAQAAVARAEAAGHTAQLTLVVLRPVGHVDGKTVAARRAELREDDSEIRTEGGDAR